jgi:cytochrome P450
MQDLFTGGAETSSTLAEWVMSELMRHPGEMAKAQAEVREAFDNINPRYHESHMDKLHYTRLVIKETLRLHPILPLLIPRLCRETCEIGGFEVTKGSTVR